ncbi:hypothetical protein FACS189440_04190 [Bacteroidia bacterium]|nr:hypothetical protein FACS189423_03000 [Bacteroidia bacterium]GHT46358.1 hypothetical protein FACS189440_04190 [Bacteroidia bacterium]
MIKSKKHRFINFDVMGSCLISRMKFMTEKKTYNIKRGIFILLFGIVVSFIVGFITWLLKSNVILSLLIGVVFSLLTGYIALFYDFANAIEKISKDLEDTHGIIIPHNSKVAITAQVISFYDDTNYSISSSVKESFDLIRHYTYQDLILSPKYLSYFFKRAKQQGKHYRIIVVKNACQASLTYIVLSHLAKYKTYVISDEHFESFCSRPCISDKGLSEIFKKGNPYIEKSSDDECKGQYSNEDKVPDFIPMAPIAYDLLVCMRDGFCQKIDNKVNTIGDLTAALRGKNQPPCSNSKPCPLERFPQ